MSHVNFEPNWVTPPGATIIDLMDEKKVSVSFLAERFDKPVMSVARLLSGVEPLTYEWAVQIYKVFGASIDFWLKREEQYRSGFYSIYKKSDIDELSLCLDVLPINDMIKYGWIEGKNSHEEIMLEILAFLGFTSTEKIKNNFRKQVNTAVYKTSCTFDSKSASVAAWLRQGEIQSRSIDCQSWNPEGLRGALGLIRKLTRVKDPNKFLPKLVEIFAGCGVAVVVVPCPEGCRASGAVKFIDNNKALLILSFRYLVDDQFWFTVFHEIGHFLLHAGEGVLLEGVDGLNERIEDEANDFAFTALFGRNGSIELRNLELNNLSFARYAKSIEISPGLVVGQLQRMKVIPYNHFQGLKVRYKWLDTNES